MPVAPTPTAPTAQVMCSSCSNGYSCGICLTEITDDALCPDNASSMSTCKGIGIGEFCEAEGEGGTKNSGTPGCGGNEVYQRVACSDTAPVLDDMAPLLE